MNVAECFACSSALLCASHALPQHPPPLLSPLGVASTLGHSCPVLPLPSSHGPVLVLPVNQIANPIVGRFVIPIVSQIAGQTMSSIVIQFVTQIVILIVKPDCESSCE